MQGCTDRTCRPSGRTRLCTTSPRRAPPSICSDMNLRQGQVKPETVLRWHRADFKAYWRWKSRRRAGRPRIDRGLRDLIGRMRGVILDEAHFIKNNSQRTSHCLKLLGVSNNAREPAYRTATGLPAHRHADDQPAARSVQSPALRRPSVQRGASSPSRSSTAMPTRTTMAGSRPEHRTSKN